MRADQSVIDLLDLSVGGVTADELYRCVHCGLCLNECPTYLELGLETESPRGRLALMKAVAEGRFGYTDKLVEHMDLCLLCRACEAACPSGVPFGSLMTETRARIQEQTPQPFIERTVKNFVFRHMFPHKRRLGLAFGMLALYQASGVQWLVRKSRVLSLLPSRLSQMESMLPKLALSPYPRGGAKSVAAEGEQKQRVALFSGCIMPLVFGPVNRATVNVLSKNGCMVDIPGAQGCCGALNVHSGERKAARQMARKNIDAFESADTVVVNAAGCGAMLKEYEELLEHDARYSEKARAFTSKVKDVNEFLAALPLIPPKTGFKKRVTYQDSCHLAHAQRIKEAPRKLLSSIPGVEFSEMRNSDRCCGAAGIYNIVNPDLSMQILDSKMRDVMEVDADVVTTANPGCMLQLDLGLRKNGQTTRSYHVVELLDQAYRQEEKSG